MYRNKCDVCFALVFGKFHILVFFPSDIFLNFYSHKLILANIHVANSGAKSPKRGRSGGKKAKTPEPEPEPEPEVPPGTPPPQPGSDEWQYVDQPIEDVCVHKS